MSIKDLVEEGIEDFLKEYRRHSHLETGREDEFYWNERDCQCQLYYYLRKYFEKDYRKKGAFWVHPEGPYEVLKKGKLKLAGRPDLIVMNPDRNSKLYDEKTSWEPYDVAIEIRLLWSGYGKEKQVKKDLEKLQKMLSKTGQFPNAKLGYFILASALNRKNTDNPHSASAKISDKSEMFFSSDLFSVNSRPLTL